MAFGMTALALTLAGAGAATKAVGQWKAGSADKAAGEAQQRAANDEAALSDWNAQVVDLQAKDAVERGRLEENRFRQNVNLLIGSQRAGFAAGNVDVGFGSAVDVQAESAHQGELDALTIRTNAAREAWGFNVQAEDLRRRAEITRKEGVNAAAAGRARQSADRWGAVGTIAATGASLLEAKYGFGKRGH